MSENTNHVSNVSAGKPKIGGAVFRAALGSTVPTDAVSELDAAFKGLGYCSEDGVTNTNSPESEVIRAWGGDVVLTPQTAKDDTWKLKLLEVKNAEVLKTVYGNENVTGDIKEGLTVKAALKELPPSAWVIDMILREDTLKRVVLPNATITEVGDIVYVDNEPVGYELTLTAMPDEAGYTHYEYLKEASGE